MMELYVSILGISMSFGCILSTLLTYNVAALYPLVAFGRVSK